MDDREMVAAMAAGDPAGIASAYDRYAAALYGYCRWMLGQPTAAAEALQDTFVVAAITIGDLPETRKLRPCLYAVARNECLRRLRTPPPAHVEEADAPDRRADAIGQPAAATDATMQFRVVGQPAPATDATVQFRVVGQPAAATGATGRFQPIGQLIVGIDLPADATVPMRAVRQPIVGIDLPADATVPMRAVRQPIGATDGPASVNGSPEQANLPILIRARLAELKPRQREVIELNLRHDLNDADLATALSVSWSRARAWAARARGQLERALGALLVARTGRKACPELDTLLSDWDGQLTEQRRDLVSRHIDKCETCTSHKLGALRPAAIAGLLPLAELPPELREQILVMCSSATPDAVAYRSRALRRAESIWSARFWPAIRRLSWRTIGSTPRSATPAVALMVWVVAVWLVSMTLLMLTHRP